MYYVKFCRAPSQMWVGSVVYKNGTYFASGRSLDHMVDRVKKRLYAVDRVPFSSVQLESTQSLPSEMPIKYMTKLFRTKYWLPKDVVMPKPETIIKNEKAELKPKSKSKPKPAVKEPVAPVVVEQKYAYHTYKVENGKLVVYGHVKIAEYNLETTTKSMEDNDGVQEQ